MNEEIIYQAKPSLITRAFFARLFCIAALIYLIPHYQENHFAISILSIGALFLFFTSGNDIITIYNDRFVQTNNSFSSLLFKSKGTSILISDIKKAYLQGTELNATELGLIVAAASALPKRSSIFEDVELAIYFDLENEKYDTIYSSLDIDKLKKIVDLLNDMTGFNT